MAVPPQDLHAPDGSGAGEKEEPEFLKLLREESLHHKEKRAAFVLQKLAFTVGLFGVGILGMKSKLSDWGGVLYALPIVALAYDVYIYAEDYKVKRIGAFFRKHDEYVSNCEKDWEKYVDDNRREPLAVLASSILTIIAAFPCFLDDGSPIWLKLGWLVLTIILSAILYRIYLNFRQNKL
jgi:hypothetical protein